MWAERRTFTRVPNSPEFTNLELEPYSRKFRGLGFLWAEELGTEEGLERFAQRIQEAEEEKVECEKHYNLTIIARKKVREKRKDPRTGPSPAN